MRRIVKLKCRAVFVSFLDCRVLLQALFFFISFLGRRERERERESFSSLLLLLLLSLSRRERSLAYIRANIRARRALPTQSWCAHPSSHPRQCLLWGPNAALCKTDEKGMVLPWQHACSLGFGFGHAGSNFAAKKKWVRGNFAFSFQRRDRECFDG